jgi:hypothetical protein
LDALGAACFKNAKHQTPKTPNSPTSYETSIFMFFLLPRKTPETTMSLDAMMSERMLLADISNQHLVLKAEHASKVSQG